MSRLAMLLLVAAMGAAVPALAGEPRSLQVPAGDLDLASPAGRAALDLRLRAAVREVCTVSDWGPGLDAQRHAEACGRKALADGAAQVEVLVKAAQSRRLAGASITVSPR
jgi:UrcA family protein